MVSLVILLFALFASLFTLSKTALDFSEPFFLIGSRMAMAGAVLVLYQFIFNRRKFHISWNHIIPLFVLGLVNIYVANIAEIWGIQYMSSAKACLLYSLSPFVAAFLAYAVLKETINFRKWLGLIIGFLGIIPILFANNNTSELANDLSLFTWADAAILLAVISSVYGWILLKKIIVEYKYTPIMANGVAMLIGGALALAHSYLSGESWQPLPIIDNQYIAFFECTIWMMIISNIICYNLYGYLLTKFSATFMSLAGLITPVFASLFGWYFLNEIITWHYYASMLIFSLGLFVFYQEEIATDFIRAEPKRT